MGPVSISTARRVAISIYERLSALMEFPEQGRQGRKSGTRELIFTGLPYLAIYRIRGDAVDRSITHDDSIVLTPLNQLNTATKSGVLVP